MLSRIPQPWLSRRESTPHIGVIFPLPHRAWIGNKNPGGCLIHLVYFPLGTKQDGRLKATTVPTEHRNSLHIFSSQTTDSGSYFCAVQHSAPQAPAAGTHTLWGLSPSSSHSRTMRPPWGHHKAFAILSISYPHWYSDNHKHFLALQIWDLVFSLPNLYLLLH